MPRKLRVEYAGAIYHVLNRGDRREPLFKDDKERERFLETLGEACAKTGGQVQALGLMPNHFQLVVETPQPNWVAGMKWLLGTDTARFIHCLRPASSPPCPSGKSVVKKSPPSAPLRDQLFLLRTLFLIVKTVFCGGTRMRVDSAGHYNWSLITRHFPPSPPSTLFSTPLTNRPSRASFPSLVRPGLFFPERVPTAVQGG